MSETFRDQSKRQWFANQAGGPTTDQLKLGCLQRIADATEAMAQEYNRLIREAKYLREDRDRYRNSTDRAARSNAALRGVIKRMKKAAKP